MRVPGSLLLLSGYLGKSSTSLLILVGFAQLAGAEGAGEFAYAMAVSFPLFVLAELALRNVYQTLAEAPPFRVFLGVRATAVVAMIALLVAAGIAVPAFPAFAVLGPLLLMRGADSMLDICYAELLAEGRIKATAGWMWVNNALTVVAVAVPISLGLPARACIVGSAGASVLVLVLVLVPVARRALIGRGSAVPASRGGLRRVLRAGITLGAAQMLGSFLIYLPTLYLTSASTKAAVGVFAVSQYVATLSNMVFSSAQQTSLRGLRRALADGGEPALWSACLRAATPLVTLGLLGSGLSLAAFPPLAPLVFGEEFQVNRWQFLPIALTVLALALDYSTSSYLLVRNRFGARVTASTVGAAAALGVAGLTWADASVTSAGYVVLAGVLARSAASAWTVREGRRGG